MIRENSQCRHNMLLCDTTAGDGGCRIVLKNIPGLACELWHSTGLRSSFSTNCRFSCLKDSAPLKEEWRPCSAHPQLPLLSSFLPSFSLHIVWFCFERLSVLEDSTVPAAVWHFNNPLPFLVECSCWGSIEKNQSHGRKTFLFCMQTQHEHGRVLKKKK